MYRSFYYCHNLLLKIANTAALLKIVIDQLEAVMFHNALCYYWWKTYIQFHPHQEACHLFCSTQFVLDLWNIIDSQNCYLLLLLSKPSYFSGSCIPSACCRKPYCGNGDNWVRRAWGVRCGFGHRAEENVTEWYCICSSPNMYKKWESE